MGLSKLYKRVVNSSINNLTETQKEVIYYLIDERLTVSQIAKIRHTSRQAINKVIKKLKDKGIIKEVVNSAYFKGGYYPKSQVSSTNEYRLHAQNFVIEIIEVTPFYLNLLKGKNRDSLDNNTLMLYKDKIIIYANKDFLGDTVNQCVRKSLDYWGRFLIKLENRFKFYLTKGERSNIKEFRGEIAKMGDPLAKKINLDKDTFRVYIGGELRLICDNSFKFDELEAVNPQHYIKDMQKVEDFYKTLLIDKSPYEYLKKQIEFNKQIQEDTQKERNEVMLMLKSLVLEVEKLKRR